MDPLSWIVIIALGFITARYVFQQVPTGVVAALISATAGLMIYITADELIPHSCAGTNHQTIFSLMAGVVFVVLLGNI